MTGNLRHRLDSGELDYIDYYFTRFIERLEDDTLAEEVSGLIADLSHALSEQHSCLDLSERSNTESLKTSLRNLRCVGDGSEPTPLVLEGNRLFLHRYFSYETRIAADLIRRNQPDAGAPKDPADSIRRWFGDAGGDLDWQQIAAMQALTRNLGIITGGPGTGKTTTVVKILAMLVEDEERIIRLAAPTGKAAMRLNQTLTALIPQLPEAVRSHLPDQVQTLHRMLGIRGDGRTARYHRRHQLPVDILVIDEVSMIDLAMMNRLLLAVPPEAKLLLLGDPDQLPSVDTGNVLADICRYPTGFDNSFRDDVSKTLAQTLPPGQDDHLLTNAICQLQKNYRFSANKGIGQLAEAVRHGEFVRPSPDDEQVELVSIDGLEQAALATVYQSWREQLPRAAEPAELIQAFDEARILSPVRDGERGVLAINEKIEATLSESGLIAPGARFYHGRPVIIMRNDYNLGLFNGDTGVSVFDADDGQFKVAFRGVDGRVRLFLASRLPPHETCFAMTVHKAQGSEFDRVVLVLPDEVNETAEKILTRELLYTAITRARERLTIYAREATVETALGRSISRHSGLGERFLPGANAS